MNHYQMNVWWDHVKGDAGPVRSPGLTLALCSLRCCSKGGCLAPGLDPGSSAPVVDP